MLCKLFALSCVITFMLATSTAEARNEKAVARNQIESYIVSTHYRQSVMHESLTRSNGSYKHSKSLLYVKWVERKWRATNYDVLKRFRNPPHLSQFTCIHGYEGSWTDTGAPYYGGLQMDSGFQGHYASTQLLAKGTANHWTPLEQIWTAEEALKTRGYWPWPNTARYCHLL